MGEFRNMCCSLREGANNKAEAVPAKQVLSIRSKLKFELKIVGWLKSSMYLMYHPQIMHL